LFAIDSGGFLNNLLSSGFNTAKQIFSLLHFISFSELRMSNGPKLFAMSFFRETQELEKKKSTGDATRAKRGPQSGPHPWPHGGTHLGP
jgi:hypothetical protein